jgi:hypothetical protein
MFPAICDLQGDFQKLQGEPIQLPATFTMISMGLKQCSWPKEQGAFFGFAGKEQGAFLVLQGGAALELRMVGRVGARGGKQG